MDTSDLLTPGECHSHSLLDTPTTLTGTNVTRDLFSRTGVPSTTLSREEGPLHGRVLYSVVAKVSRR